MTVLALIIALVIIVICLIAFSSFAQNVSDNKPTKYSKFEPLDISEIDIADPLCESFMIKFRDAPKLSLPEDWELIIYTCPKCRSVNTEKLINHSYICLDCDAAWDMR